MFKLNEKEMAPKYDFKTVEKGKYKYWLENGFLQVVIILRFHIPLLSPHLMLQVNCILVMLGIQRYKILSLEENGCKDMTPYGFQEWIMLELQPKQK